MAAGRNPFVNQVFGFQYLQQKLITLADDAGRNPFVNQVFGFEFKALCAKEGKSMSQSLRESGLWFRRGGKNNCRPQQGRQSQSLRESGLWFQRKRSAEYRRHWRCRNPFVNQVFGFSTQIMFGNSTLPCRNPFVNQVFGFAGDCGAANAGDCGAVAIPS